MRMIDAKGFDERSARVAGDRSGGAARRSPDPAREPAPRARAAADTFERVQERGRAHLVTLLGEPGIGKTRVVEEFLGTACPTR